MRRTIRQPGAGFSLLEMMISMAVGLLVLASAVAMYTQAMNANYTVSQRSEMQQNARAAVDLMARDISLANYGMPNGGVQLPLGGTGGSIYSCGTSGCYTGFSGGSGPTGVAFPLVPAYGTSPAVSNTLYGLMPGYRKGISISSSTSNTDIVSLVYQDWSFPLTNYTITGCAQDGSSVNWSSTTAAINMINGIQAGDLILLNTGGGNGYAIGAVTSVSSNPGTSGGYTGTVQFTDHDVLAINQSSATSGNLATLIKPAFPTSSGGSGPPTAAGCGLGPNQTPVFWQRISLITYYIDIPRGPDGILYTADDGPPRLMKQINAQPPSPVAENIVGLNLTYDVADTSGNVTAALPDGGISSSPPFSPNQIIKVNLSVSARSPLKNAVGVIKGYQSTTVQTSIGARDMSYRDRYN